MANAEHEEAISVHAGAQDLPEGGNIDKIRDILFGAQSREFEKRMARLDERMNKETAGLKEDLRTRFESLEIYVKGEVDALSERLRSEQADRLESLKEVARDLKETARGSKEDWASSPSRPPRASEKFDNRFSSNPRVSRTRSARSTSWCPRPWSSLGTSCGRRERPRTAGWSIPGGWRH
ncbi:MAG: hypothetical protein ABJA98_01005 [Acidobacteriota bacterium]